MERKKRTEKQVSDGYKMFQKTLQDILSRDVLDEQITQQLEQLGLAPTFSNAIGLQAVTKAAQQDGMDAAKFIRDTLGEKYSGDVKAKTVRALDLSKLSDEQLEVLADRTESS